MVSLSGILDAVLSFIQSNWLLFEILAFAFLALILSLGVQTAFVRQNRKKKLFTLLKTGMKPEEANAIMEKEQPSPRKRYYIANLSIVVFLSLILYFLPPYDYLGLLVGFLTPMIVNGFTFYRNGLSRAYNVASIIGKYIVIPGLINRLRHRKPKVKAAAVAAPKQKEEKPPRSFSPLKKFFLGLFAFMAALFLWAGVLLLVKYSTGVEFTSLILSLPFDNLAFMFLAIGVGVLLLMLFFATFVGVLRIFKKIIKKVRK